jgi:predicted P-loop ATPase
VDSTNNKRNKLPDFKQLEDRVIANASTSPSLVIKTNLDQEDPTVENPYASGQDDDSLKEFFDE